MNYIYLDKSDDQQFGELIEQLIVGSLRGVNPETVYVIKVDNWFGQKWLSFSHKSMGEFGVSRGNHVLPPFVPSRVISERAFELDGDGVFHETETTSPIHINQTSELNQKRKLMDLYPNSAFYWWSGCTVKNTNGSLMAYLPSSGGFLSWYVGFKRGDSWVYDSICGVSNDVIRSYERAT